MKPNAAVWFEIYVQDMDRAKRFYESVLKTHLSKLDTPVPGLDMWMFDGQPDAPGATGALVCMHGVPSGANSTLVYFHCEDCAVEEARVKAAGGEVHRPKMSIGKYGAISLVLDTEGNMIGLHSLQ